MQGTAWRAPLWFWPAGLGVLAVAGLASWLSDTPWPMAVGVLFLQGLWALIERWRFVRLREVVDTGCLWCTHGSVDASDRCPECGRFTTQAHRHFARRMLGQA